MRALFKALLVLAVLCGPNLASAEISGALRIIDGDTFDVQGTRVRLFGIDAPEQDQTCTSEEGSVWNCGAWVTTKVRDLFEGRHVVCTAKDSGRYGRTVARCFVEGEDVAQTLVQQGLAFAYRKYSFDYDLDEKGAAIRSAGLHRSKMQSPAQFRRYGGTRVQTVTSECRIKGNISSKGTRIYHSPGQRDYDKTRISASKGERWFCSATQAEAAGWRAARR